VDRQARVDVVSNADRFDAQGGVAARAASLLPAVWETIKKPQLPDQNNKINNNKINSIPTTKRTKNQELRTKN
jgi:hypothetical protein